MSLRPNRIMSQPATVKACASDLRSPDERAPLAKEARAQLEQAREHAAETVAIKALGRG